MSRVFFGVKLKNTQFPFAGDRLLKSNGIFDDPSVGAGEPGGFARRPNVHEINLPPDRALGVDQKGATIRGFPRAVFNILDAGQDEAGPGRFNR